ncbi:carotenoid 9,10(9',10')-cleavage dioxygenase 1-like protein [Trifolium pratense]|uniref:Carotenoid 9,10(9',10')-cleavage dioxygenase 1-like protein n=1 Tax=Trifolium pratense TaxID=57577 RepID=A0A2K3LUE0_TRIPR|nr:carotenoid 9,10(9',10')-cleavage dioxygenase 1-like protein [Trifolium pratense]
MSSSRLNSLGRYRGNQVFTYSNTSIHYHKPICVKIKSVAHRGGNIVKVEPKPRKGFTSKVVDLLEMLVVKFFYDSSLSHHWLAGNFAPVQDETPPVKNLPVNGYLPVSERKLLLFVLNFKSNNF